MQRRQPFIHGWTQGPRGVYALPGGRALLIWQPTHDCRVLKLRARSGAMRATRVHSIRVGTRMQMIVDCLIQPVPFAELEGMLLDLTTVRLGEALQLDVTAPVGGRLDFDPYIERQA